MAKVNWDQFATQFGESFIRTLERERTLRQQQEEFNRRMQFENRQLTLYTDIAKERSAIEKEQTLAQMYGQGFTPDEETPQIKLFGKGLDYPLPAPPKPEESANIKFMPELGWVEEKLRGETPYDYNMLRGLPETKKRVDRNVSESDTYKEPKLTEAGARGLAWLKSPLFTRASGENLVAMTKDEIANEFTTALSSLSKDVLTSRTSKWLNTLLAEYKKQGRIPTVAELDDRIVEHYEKYKTLNDKDVEELNVLMNYLSEADSGIQSIYQKIK